MKKLLIIGLAVLGLTACSPEPVKYTQKGKEKASFHMENDDILEAGIREITKGVYLRKFKIGNDTIYIRCDKEGNPISNDVTINYREGKHDEVVGFI